MAEDDEEKNKDRFKSAINLKELITALLGHLNSWGEWRLHHPIESDPCDHSRNLVESFNKVELSLLTFMTQDETLRKAMGGNLQNAEALIELHKSGMVKLSDLFLGQASQLHIKHSESQKDDPKDHASSIGLFIKK